MAFADARSSAPVGSSRAIGPCARFSPCRPRGAARASTRVSSGRDGSARYVRPTNPSTGRAAEICSDEAPQLTDWPIEYLDNGAVKFRDNCTGEWAQTYPNLPARVASRRHPVGGSPLSADGLERLCQETDEFSTRCSRQHTSSGSGASALRPGQSHGQRTRDESIRSAFRRSRSAMASLGQSACRGFPWPVIGG